MAEKLLYFPLASSIAERTPAPERIPHDEDALKSRLRTFSTLASHLRARVPRIHSEEDAVYAEIALLRAALGYSETNEALRPFSNPSPDAIRAAAILAGRLLNGDDEGAA